MNRKCSHREHTTARMQEVEQCLEQLSRGHGVLIAFSSVNSVANHSLRWICALILSLAFYTANAGTLTAEATVKATTQEILSRLQADQTKLKLHPEYIQIIVKELVVPHFDFVTMSQLVLGDHWHTISKPKQMCFTVGFRNLLIVRYANIFLSYAGSTDQL